MKIIISFILSFFLLYIQVEAEPLNNNEIVMIEVEDRQLETVLTHVREEYPNVTIRQMYKQAFYGMSVQGPTSAINEIKKMRGVKSVTPVMVYKVDIDESIPFITGTDTRGSVGARGEKLTGKGVKIGVIDTGIDYKHPDLKGNYRGGYDTVDFDKDPMETKGGEGKRTLHGTHVAGIIAANGKIKGIAPEASIYAYRALGPGGVGTTESVIAAIERAITDKVDIINLSLGNDVNGPDWPTSEALNRAVEKGIIAITASGNSGPGMWSVGSPGTASSAIVVGASFPPLEVPILKTKKNKEEISVIPMQGSIPWVFSTEEKCVDGGLGRKDDIKWAKNKLVLIERGMITFTEKVKNAEKSGAKGVIIYNNSKGGFMGKIEGVFSIPVVTISQKDGSWLRRQLKEGNNKIISGMRQQVDKLAFFSSRGPVTMSWEIKPDIVAPGVAINSTIPGGYMSLQGTSMASPHVAGAAALLKQVHPKWNPQQIKAALLNTAKYLKKDDSSYYHFYEQGAGRIQVARALQTETLVYPATLSLGMFSKQEDKGNQNFSVTIENLSATEKQYSLSTIVQKNIQFQFPQRISVLAGEKKVIPIVVHIPTKTVEKGIYEGKFCIGEGETSISVPYMFLVDEESYPRIMGFQLGETNKKNHYEYEVYLSEGADEMSIMLYDPLLFTFVTTLDVQRNVGKGMQRRVISAEGKDLQGIYRALVHVKREGRDDVIESYIELSKAKIKNRAK